eukprot:5748296-Prymnesium_polylepis.1
MLLKNLDPVQKLVNGSRGKVVSFTQGSSRTPIPVVDFETAPGVYKRCKMERAEFNVELADNTAAQRIQVPLRLAWAISIHKSQGMTIPQLMVDLKDCFAEGQVYVALSRAVSMEQTRILSFDERKVKTNTRVVEFMTGLGRVGLDTRGSEGDGSLIEEDAQVSDEGEEGEEGEPTDSIDIDGAGSADEGEEGIDDDDESDDESDDENHASPPSKRRHNGDAVVPHEMKAPDAHRGAQGKRKRRVVVGSDSEED